MGLTDFSRYGYMIKVRKDQDSFATRFDGSRIYPILTVMNVNQVFSELQCGMSDNEYPGFLTLCKCETRHR